MVKGQRFFRGALSTEGNEENKDKEFVSLAVFSSKRRGTSANYRVTVDSFWDRLPKFAFAAASRSFRTGLDGERRPGGMAVKKECAGDCGRNNGSHRERWPSVCPIHQDALSIHHRANADQFLAT